MCVCVGTDATHAEHIETIKSRNYVGVQGDGCFVPGELGMGLVEGEAKQKPMLELSAKNDSNLLVLCNTIALSCMNMAIAIATGYSFLALSYGVWGGLLGAH